MRAHTQPPERRPERIAADASVQCARGRGAQHQPPQRRSETLRGGQLLLLRPERRDRQPAQPLQRALPHGHHRNGCRRRPVMELQARTRVVLHAARRRRETPAPLRR